MVTAFRNIPESKRLPKKNLLKMTSLFFFGPLYSLQKQGKRIYLKLHFSFNLYLQVPKECRIFTFKKRLILFGDSRILQNFVKGIISLRDPNIYTGTGIRPRTKMYITKPGKIRKR